MPSIVDLIKERARQTLTGDVDYYKNLKYAFKLITVAGKGPGMTSSTLFPLPINPQVFEYDLPFAAEITATQEGGAIADEGGIIFGSIRIEATTGFRLRKNIDTSIESIGSKFMGLIPYEISNNQKISGQMALWRLLGRCFESYSELKKDPEVAQYTRLEFHGLKDRLHLEIVPRRVRVPRNVSDMTRTAYKYHIEADVIGAAQPPDVFDMSVLTDDRSILDMIDDAVRAIRNGIDALRATIDDLTASMDHLKRHLNNIVGIVDEVKRVVEAGDNFLNGVTSFFDMPANAIGSLAELLEAEIEYAETLSAIPKRVTRIMKNAVDHLEAVSVGSKRRLRDDWNAKASNHIGNVQSSTNLTTAEQDQAQALATTAGVKGGRMTMHEAFGGRYTPGDAKRAELPPQTPSVRPDQYTGYKEVEITRADTIQSLANRHLGDPARWREIAMINNLRAPYILQGTRLPNTLTTGDPILVPIKNPRSPVQVVSTGTRIPGASHIEMLMGRDIRQIRLSNGKRGWAIDSAHGSTDLQYVVGVPNLVQGLGTRCRTIRGNNENFPNVGLPEIVGNNDIAQRWMEMRFNFAHEVLADPRIAKLVSFRFELDNQVVTVTIEAQPVGYDTSRVIPLTLT